MNYYWIGIIILIIILGLGIGLILLSNNENTSIDRNVTEVLKSNGTDMRFNLVFHGQSTNYKNSILTASQRWSTYITNSFITTVDFYTYSENSSTLAYARMNNTNDLKGGGEIYINTTHTPPNAGWDDVIEHELGHVLGLPGYTLFDNARFISGGKYYLNTTNFPNVAQAYTDITGNNNNDVIPLEDGLGYHWNEAIFTTELMTPAIGTEPELITSILTLSAMKDMGWDIDLNTAESFP
jgi:hypothetical protein